MFLFSPKAAGDVLPYTWDLSGWLAYDAYSVQDTVVSATVTATPDDLVVGLPAITPTTVSVTVAGGTDGVTYLLVCVITTAAAMIAQAEATLLVQEGVR